MIYNIIEIANTHGGSIDYLRGLIKEFEDFTEGYGMKFQPFKYDEIATPDYEWFEVYKKLYISKGDWAELIDYVSITKDVWIDVFDGYGIEIIRHNLNKIKGIKLQASILMNRNLLQSLSNLNMTEKKLIINISGYELSEIKERLSYINKLIKPQEILLEVGFQSYPTELMDAGVSKLKEIKAHFDNRIVFADHVDGSSEHAIWLPVIAAMLGVDVIEKHVMHSNLETEYDRFSSVKVDDYRKYIELQKKYISLLDQSFINDREKVYLEKSIQLPILKANKNKGSTVSLEDLSYKRTGKNGLNTKQLEELLMDFHILTTDKRAGEPLYVEDFKKATIATVIACRLKSTRLPKKALLPIGNLSSIELCLKNALKFRNVNHTILATSSMEEDRDLERYCYREDVIFHKGDPDDVIQRYLDIVRMLKVDVIIRATGDCPYLSNDICQFLLKAHFVSGADYTCGVGEAVGTSVEIINAAALERVKSYFPRADYSEYMTWYFQNNPEYFKVNKVKLPEKWCRDYRLTLDYEEDLSLFNTIEKYFSQNNLEYTLEALFKFLDQNPEVAGINKHLRLRYKSDPELIRLLDEVTKIRS
ncbi:spore coat polysaccharide biosynthesis protein SpsF (cytidylyltransferase family)/sialic acid synthase SpsE [Anaerosolibacter carboniphilus]|uniref:Spore coat polysaccharide biosynthesis protein SpsF (Cytidylyltransferase family)/sialic acid synthase SpsE n=1 Tax=Anaerosolibacter carboniphilus TaxID=1417629 RepID=A0A841KQN3_9FIRM|nr:N-acetylneuraminate synthase family protein [Anaerosolibacter carboniphilus]MBB6215733.1 spore coat polysaccharide biosynthesis protein SpsF (cytidylyltransferase family)/sialic acid synthase SpsE [Anaerosolibacter carboniphilus]